MSPDELARISRGVDRGWALPNDDARKVLDALKNRTVYVVVEDYAMDGHTLRGAFTSEKEAIAYAADFVQTEWELRYVEPLTIDSPPTD